MKILIVYDSLTGNVERFANKLVNHKILRLNNNTIVDEPFILITYTIDFGGVPDLTEDFLYDFSEYLQGVCVSGNRNWGTNYARAADTIAEQYDIPVLHKFEMSGSKKDVEIIQMEVDRIDNTITKMD